jgi:hypothetical protein
VTDPDLEELGKLWRKEPDAEEMRGLHRSAEQVMRRARLALVFEYVLAAVTVGVVLFIVAYNPPDRQTAIAGSAAILVLLLSQMRQRRLRQWELQSLTREPETMIQRSIARVESTLKRAWWGAVVIGPATLFGVIFAFIADEGNGQGALSRLRAEPGGGTAIVAGAAAVVLGVIIHLARTIRRSNREISRLRQLKEAFRVENEGSSA